MGGALERRVKKCLGAVGGNTIVGTRIEHYTFPKQIFLGTNISIGMDCWFYASSQSRIEVGDGTIIAPRCRIYATMHNYNSPDLHAVPYDERNIVDDVIIGAGCWLGDGVVVMPGVHIGDGAVIGAGGVVTKDVEKYAVMAGVPCRKIGNRDAAQFEKLLKERSFARNFGMKKTDIQRKG